MNEIRPFRVENFAPGSLPYPLVYGKKLCAIVIGFTVHLFLFCDTCVMLAAGQHRNPIVNRGRTSLLTAMFCLC